MTDSLPGGTRSAALRFLLERHSVGPKHMAEPGPTDEELLLVARAALRAPDHEKLIPFRFVVARGDGLQRLASLFEDYGRRRGKTGEELAAERQRATQAPVVIAVVVCIDDSVPDVPAHEQWACAGGAVANAMNALHLLGYGAKMLSGERATDRVMREAFCRPGESILGWIATGTAKAPGKARGPDDPARILGRF